MVSSKQATALRCRLQHAATGDAMRCDGQRTALRHLADNLHRTAPSAARGTETEKPRTNNAVRGFWEFISELNSKACSAFGSLLSLYHHLGLCRADWAFGIEL